MKNLCAIPWVGFSNDPNGSVENPDKILSLSEIK